MAQLARVELRWLYRIKWCLEPVGIVQIQRRVKP